MKQFQEMKKRQLSNFRLQTSHKQIDLLLKNVRITEKKYALDEELNEIEVEGEELLARALCHEIEHLDGHLYVEKVEGDLMDVGMIDDDEE